MRAYVQRVPPAGEASFVYRVKADAQFARGLHCHPECELTYIVESRGRRIVGDSVEDYEAGDCVLLGPDVPHAWRSEELPRSSRRGGRRPLHRAIVVQFRPEFLGGAFLEAPELSRIRAIVDRARLGLRFTGRTRDEVVRCLESMRDLEGLDRLLELLRALRAIAAGGRDVRAIASRTLVVSPDPAHLERIERVIAYLEANFARRPSQQTAARLVGMSPPSFSRYFRRATGRTFVGYLSELRVSRAAKLLRETQRSVTHIALEAGFNNLSNFNRRFLALRGTTPRKYRVEHAEACRGRPEA